MFEGRIQLWFLDMKVNHGSAITKTHKSRAQMYKCLVILTFPQAPQLPKINPQTPSLQNLHKSTTSKLRSNGLYTANLTTSLRYPMVPLSLRLILPRHPAHTLKIQTTRPRHPPHNPHPRAELTPGLNLSPLTPPSPSSVASIPDRTNASPIRVIYLGNSHVERLKTTGQATRLGKLCLEGEAWNAGVGRDKNENVIFRLEQGLYNILKD